MFVDAVSMVLKPNGTVVSSGPFTPVMWNMGDGIWWCKHGKRTLCKEPLNFKPGNGQNARYTLGYEDLPVAKGLYSPDEISEHEEAIFHEESKQKILNGLGEDILNLRPTKITFKSLSQQAIDYLFNEVSPHSAFMLIMTLVFILDNAVGWGKRIIHVYKNKLSFWNYLLTPFNQISLFNFLPWKKLSQLGNQPELLEVYKKYVKEDNNYVSVDMKSVE